jgi:hypothetical protein
MFVRSLLTALFCCASLNVYAAVSLYEFEGYIATKTDHADPGFSLPSSQFPVGARFTGTLTVDPERVRWDPELQQYVDHSVVELTLQTENGGAFTLDSAQSGGVSMHTEYGGERVSVSSTGNLQTTALRYFAAASLGWESLNQGQLPADESNLNLGGLQSGSWNLSLSTMNPDCAPECDGHARLRGQITGLWKQGSAGTGYGNTFDTSPGWTNSGGNWVVDGGTYRNSANVAFTTSVNTGFELGPTYDLSSRLYTQWSATGNTLGLLFNYRDGSNFDEVRFNAAGTATLNRVRNGNRSMLRTAQYPGAARTWFDVRVSRVGNQIRVWAGGARIFDVDGGTPAGAYLGVFASWNQARFDDVRVVQIAPWLLTTSTFNSVPPAGWSAQIGQWTVTDGYYLSSSNLAAAISTTIASEARDYAIDTSMYLEWSSKGNRGGLVYDYQDSSNYRAVLFNSGTRVTGGIRYDGSFEVIEVRNGVRRIVLPPEPIGNTQILSKMWDGVGVRRNGDTTTITYFDRTISLRQSAVSGSRRFGLIASYNRVRFDDVVIGIRSNSF